MAYRFAALLALALAFPAAMPSLASENARLRATPLTTGGAVAEVTHAVRRDRIMTIVVQFVTDDPDYRGETIYADIPENEIVRRVYLQAGDRDFALLREGGEIHMPEALHLEANESEEAGVVVGEWEGVFVAPDSDLREITLFLPNLDPIGPFPIRNR